MPRHHQRAKAWEGADHRQAHSEAIPAMAIDWSEPQPSYEELHARIEALQARLRYLQLAYDTLRADHDEAHRVVDFIIASRADAKLAAT